MYDMNKLVQARLDPATAELLARLRRATGENDSEIVRRGIAALSQTLPRARTRRIHGLGRFASKVADLGSNKRHLSGFGRK